MWLLVFGLSLKLLPTISLFPLRWEIRLWLEGCTKIVLVSILSRDTVADLIELDMVAFDAILGMD